MIAGGGANEVVSGLVILSDAGACPTGYTRITALDNKFLQGNTTYNAAAGGASTHQHPNHSHGSIHSQSISTANVATSITEWSGSSTVVQPTHHHGTTFVSFTGTGIIVNAADNRPSFSTFLICQKD